MDFSEYSVLNNTKQLNHEHIKTKQTQKLNTVQAGKPTNDVWPEQHQQQWEQPATII